MKLYHKNYVRARQIQGLSGTFLSVSLTLSWFDGFLNGTHSSVLAAKTLVMRDHLFVFDEVFMTSTEFNIVLDIT